MNILQKYSKLEEKQDNRDKFLKLIQNVQLLRCYIIEEKDQEIASLMFSQYQYIYLCRRLYKLFKSIGMVYNIIDHYNKSQTLYNKSVNNVSTYLVNIFNFLFHIVENLMVIHQLGFYEKQFNHKSLKIVSHSFWALGLVSQIAYYLNRLRWNFSRESELKNQVINGMTPQEFIKNLKQLSEQRYQIGLLLIRFSGDLVCALQKTHIPEKLIQQGHGGCRRNCELFDLIAFTSSQRLMIILEKQQLIAYWIANIGFILLALLDRGDFIEFFIVRLSITILQIAGLLMNQNVKILVWVQKIVLFLYAMITKQRQTILQFCLCQDIFAGFYTGFEYYCFQFFHIFGVQVIIIYQNVYTNELGFFMLSMYFQILPLLLKMNSLRKKAVVQPQVQSVEQKQLIVNEISVIDEFQIGITYIQDNQINYINKQMIDLLQCSDNQDIQELLLDQLKFQIKDDSQSQDNQQNLKEIIQLVNQSSSTNETMTLTQNTKLPNFYCKLAWDQTNRSLKLMALKN
ncbi:hypothetical protein pb186bvf_003385 [Paramecium bursaria]